MAASVPLETRRTRSTDGTIATSRSASSTSASVGAPNEVPRPAASLAASTISGRAWPKSSEPHDCTRSTYCRPSASWRTAPSPRTTNGGVPPTAPNARTGELTPPGITRRARSNSSSDRVTGLSSPTTTLGRWACVSDSLRATTPTGRRSTSGTSNGGRSASAWRTCCGHGRLVALHRPAVDPVGRVDRPERGGDRRRIAGKPFDPYPFILLNLVLSFQAAYTGPVVMMSQNRQTAKDRDAAEHDYRINEETFERLKRLEANQQMILDEIRRRS